MSTSKMLEDAAALLALASMSASPKCPLCKGTGKRPDFEGHAALVTPKKDVA